MSNKSFCYQQDPKVSSWLTDVMQFQEQRERVVNHVRSKIIYFSQRKEDNKYIQNTNQVVNWNEKGREWIAHLISYLPVLML